MALKAMQDTVFPDLQNSARFEFRSGNGLNALLGRIFTR